MNCGTKTTQALTAQLNVTVITALIQYHNSKATDGTAEQAAMFALTPKIKPTLWR